MRVFEIAGRPLKACLKPMRIEEFESLYGTLKSQSDAFEGLIEVRGGGYGKVFRVS